MNNRKLPLLAMLTAIAGATMCTACGSADSPKQSFEEPFSFAEVQRLAAPIGTLKDPSDLAAIARLRRQSPRISELYDEALARFESIYGDGVGPARETANYLGCKATFRQVAGQIGQLPIPDTDLGVEATWAALKHCHEVANEWAGPAEMATFGNDMKAMTEGSMLVLSYAATASQMASGQQHYREAISLRSAETPANQDF